MVFNKSKKQEESDIELVLLKEVNSNYLLGIIEELLKSNNIPYITRDNGPGDYMRIYAGGSIYGTKIFVEKTELERAREIIAGI